MDRDEGRQSNERVIHLEVRVFPLLNVRKEPRGGHSTVEYKGTCFLTRLAGNHVFVTAKHLLKKSPDKYDLHIGFNTPDGRASTIKVESMYVNHTRQDVSFFIPTPAMRRVYESVLVPMEVVKHPLPVGQGVLVYGFPDSGWDSVFNGLPVVSIRRTRHEGKVIEVERDYPLTQTSMSTVYRLDFPAPGGLSGAPVMVTHTGDVAVAGYVLGEQDTDGEPYAIATDYTLFVEIEQLLLDAWRKVESGSD